LFIKRLGTKKLIQIVFILIFADPIISKNPEGSVKYGPLRMGTQFTIKGCHIKSTFVKGFYAYWMKDGQHYEKVEMKRNEKKELVFPDLQFNRLSDNHNGSYRCALNIPGRQLQLSNPVDVHLEGDSSLYSI